MSNRQGFTLIEFMFVLMFGGILLGMSGREYARRTSQMAVRNAGNALIQTAARARSEAMQRGTLVFLRIDPATGRAEVEQSDGTVLYALDAAEFGAEMAGNAVSLCYASRGYALPGCTDITAVETIHYYRGPDSAAVAVMPLGQIRRAP